MRKTVKNFIRIMLVIMLMIISVGGFSYAENRINQNENSLETTLEKVDSVIEKTLNGDVKITNDKGELLIKTVEFSDKGEINIEIPIEMKNPIMEYFDNNGGYNLTSIFDDIGKDAALLLIKDDGNSIILGRGVCYKDVKPGIIDKADMYYSVNLKKVDGNYKIIINLSLKDKSEFNSKYKYSYYIVRTKEKPFKNLDSFKKINSVFRLKTHFILPNGYYFPMNSDSVPYSERYFFLHPACYVVNTLLEESEGAFSNLMTKTILGLARDNINEYGYVPIPYRSNWLKKDYNIDEGYFDTRWNLDLAYVSLRSYDKYKDKFYLELAGKILEYYKNYCMINKMEVVNTKGEIGYLIGDYTIGKGKKDTHSSLNHHLMGIKTFFYMNKFKKDDEYINLANMMIKGIEITYPNWIKKNGDLHYARLINGSYGMKDYPTLTLNDLKDVNTLYNKIYGKTNKTLDNLIKTKEKWLNEIYLPSKNSKKIEDDSIVIFE